MSKKSLSATGKSVLLFGFLVMFLMTASSQPAIGADGSVKLNKNLKLGLNVGLTLTNEAFVSKDPHVNILVIIRIPIPRPDPPPWWDICLEAGYNEFQWDLALADDKFTWWNVNPTLRLTFGEGNFKPFISAGPGFYFPEEGKARFGAKGGFGIDYQLSDKLMFEIGADYHYISINKEAEIFWGSSFNFFHAHAGIVISF